MEHLLRPMLIFAAVVEEGSISAAAETLALSKSVVSFHLQKLESIAGVKLLIRTTRRQTLTAPGQVFYEQCRELREQTAAAWAQLRMQSSVVQGMVVLTAPHVFIEPIVTPALAQLLPQHPAITPRIVADDAWQDLIANNIGLALRIGDLPDNSLLIARRIGSFRDVLCAAPSLIAKIGTELPALLAADYIGSEWQGRTAKHVLHEAKAALPMTMEWTITRRANTLLAVAAMAKAGLGIASLPEFFIADDLLHGRLQHILPQYQQHDLAVNLLHPFGRSVPLAVRHCADAIARVAKGKLRAASIGLPPAPS